MNTQERVGQTVAVYTHADCQKHVLFPFFAEKPERLIAVRDELESKSLILRQARPASYEELSRAHDPAYIAHVEKVSLSSPVLAFARQLRGGRVQWYTRISAGSFMAARHAAGAVVSAVDDVIAQGGVVRAFCAVRPPGHHAGPGRGEGFCLFNNVAIGALHARHRGINRIAVVDFDRHHGNGTQDILDTRAPELLFVSSYQQGCKYSGNADHGGLNSVPVTIPVGSRFDAVARLYEDKVLPRLRAYRPDLLLISAGFDMHKSDPLSSVKLEAGDYAPLTRAIIDAAAAGRQNLPVISVLEGGYDTAALRACVRHHVQALGG